MFSFVSVLLLLFCLLLFLFSYNQFRKTPIEREIHVIREKRTFFKKRERETGLPSSMIIPASLWLLPPTDSADLQVDRLPPNLSNWSLPLAVGVCRKGGRGCLQGFVSIAGYINLCMCVCVGVPDCPAFESRRLVGGVSSSDRDHVSRLTCVFPQ